MGSDTIVTLILAIEDLYYVLYARLVIEIGNVQLCSSFNLDIRRLSGKDIIVLPEPSHLLAILNICKGVLDARQVCQVLNEEIIEQHQEEFVQQAIKKYRDMGRQPDDVLGYRRHVRKLINDPDSGFSQEWRGLNPVYQMAPKEILAILSEKYLSVTPREKPAGNVVSLDLPFIDPNTVDPGIWEQKIIRAHRQATLAILEGKSVGEVRREDDRGCNLMDYVKEKKCVCFSFCSCARECTKDAERLCPCAERMMRGLLVEQSGQTFAERCRMLAEVVFEGLSAVKREASEDEMASELTLGLELFKKEVLKHRQAKNETRN
ncbi:hypothetical protein VTN77DRAFT_4088 [Rasamsonia byssochlamydoides]|uniref:uncharacterized protein n=1 Tax=Rasamsonia byssochlamydoides TaxID=89139 RepID=UPI0037442C0A